MKNLVLAMLILASMTACRFFYPSSGGMPRDAFTSSTMPATFHGNFSRNDYCHKSELANLNLNLPCSDSLRGSYQEPGQNESISFNASLDQDSSGTKLLKIEIQAGLFTCYAYAIAGEIRKGSGLNLPTISTKVDSSSIAKFEQVIARNAKNVARLQEYEDNEAAYALVKDMYSELSGYCNR